MNSLCTGNIVGGWYPTKHQYQRNDILDQRYNFDAMSELHMSCDFLFFLLNLIPDEIFGLCMNWKTKHASDVFVPQLLLKTFLMHNHKLHYSCCHLEFMCFDICWAIYFVNCISMSHSVRCCASTHFLSTMKKNLEKTFRSEWRLAIP